MIDHQEILDFSREFGLSAHIIEKDYVLYWLLAGITSHPEIKANWIFKGGTCLKKCYFETYRFSEDLDFTITKKEHMNQEFLTDIFGEIAAWVYEKSGIEMPKQDIRFEIFKNPRGKLSAEGRIYYRGPLQQRANLPRIKLDLSPDEIVVLQPVGREVHHPYSDKPIESYAVPCYCFEELYAEKIRALDERLRPRDLYDVINIYRHGELELDREQVVEVLKQKCDFKGITVPSMEILANKPELAELKSEWSNMLAHQLPVLPPFEQYWHELPSVLDWLYRAAEKPTLVSINAEKAIDETWRPPAMAQAWNLPIPLETIRFAAANRLCVILTYNNTERLIEPYSLRRTKDGNILLYAVKHETGETRAYRVDRIRGVLITKEVFVPKFTIELSTTVSQVISRVTHKSTTLPFTNMPESKIRTPKSSRGIRTYFGPKYIYECPLCHRRFTKKTNNATLGKHKDRNGMQCFGRTGIYVDTKYN